MVIWMSGELQADIDDAYRITRNEMESMINAAIADMDYGKNVMKWALIPIILNFEDPVYHEVRKHHKARKVIEFRLKINHAAFKQADDLGKRKLIFQTILRSIDLARSMKLENFNLDRFEQDVRQVGLKNGWTQ